jgi:hypothetical protein
VSITDTGRVLYKPHQDTDVVYPSTRASVGEGLGSTGLTWSRVAMNTKNPDPQSLTRAPGGLTSEETQHDIAILPTARRVVLGPVPKPHSEVHLTAPAEDPGLGYPGKR